MKSRHVPDLLVEKLVLGELGPVEAERVRRELAAAGELHLIEALAERQHPEPIGEEFAHELARAKRREESRQRTRSRTFALLVTASAFAVMALVIGIPHLGTRGKGGAGLAIYRQAANAQGYEPLAEDAHARAGDVLQLGIHGGGAGEGALYSIDGNGMITEHLAPSALPKGKEKRLPSAFILDEAPRFERFLLVLGERLDPAAIREALDRIQHAPETAPLVVDGARVISRMVLKDHPPR